MINFLERIFDPGLRKMCNAAVTDIALNRYKQNWSLPCDLLKVEKFYVLRFSFVCWRYNSTHKRKTTK